MTGLLLAAALAAAQPAALSWDNAVLCSVALQLAAGEAGREEAEFKRLSLAYGGAAEALGKAEDRDTAFQRAIYEGAFSEAKTQSPEQFQGAVQACHSRGLELFPARTSEGA